MGEGKMREGDLVEMGREMDQGGRGSYLLLSLEGETG